jgi:capsular polysaccharide biosynthesis protein
MADSITGSSSRELGDYRSLLERRWRWIALGLVLGLGAAFAYLELASPTYVSTAKVLVTPTGGVSASATAPSPEVNLDTEAELVTSAPVATRVATMLETSEPAPELASRVTVTVPPNTDVLAIAYEAGTPEDAQEGAQAFADAYLDNRRETAQEGVDAKEQQLTTQLSATTQRLLNVTRKLTSENDPPSPGQQAALAAQADSLRAQRNLQSTQLQSFRGPVASPGTLNEPAQRPTRPTDPNPWLVLPSGLMLGLLLGLALATVRERTDRRLHSSADVERLFNLPVLAQLNPRRTSLAALNPGERLDHDLRALFHAVEAATREGAQLVLVVNPTIAQPAGEVARALCLVAARTGARTSYLTRMAGSETLLGAAWRRNGNRSDLDITNYADVGVVADGDIRPTALHGVLTRLRQERDFVVLDMPTGDQVIDIPVLARHADVVLVAVELGRTARSDVSETLTLLLRSSATNIYGVTIRRGRRGPKPSSQVEDLQRLPTAGPASPTANASDQVSQHRSRGRRGGARGGSSAR